MMSDNSLEFSLGFPNVNSEALAEQHAEERIVTHANYHDNQINIEDSPCNYTLKLNFQTSNIEQDSPKYNGIDLSKQESDFEKLHFFFTQGKEEEPIQKENIQASHGVKRYSVEEGQIEEEKIRDIESKNTKDLEEDTKNDLKRQKKSTHTESKPFQCPFCLKRYTTKAHLIDHERSHTGERPYHCEICNKRFMRITTKNTHLKIHTKEKPYACPYCNYPFSEPGNLKAHLRIHV